MYYFLEYNFKYHYMIKICLHIQNIKTIMFNFLINAKLFNNPI